MREFDPELIKRSQTHRLQRFQDLMRYRINEILLVASLYDSFILEEDGRLHEMILSEYIDLNLSHAPGLTQVSSGKRAIEMACEQGRFDLIVTTLNPGDIDAVELVKKIRAAGLTTPVVLLAYDNRELSDLISSGDDKLFDKMFIWHGDFRILIATVKYLEDKRNCEHDIGRFGVQAIIVIEDNVSFYSSYLPMIYTEVLRHTLNLLTEGINISHKLLRMRARPKILLCNSYEEAWGYYKKYEDCILGLIADVEFPRNNAIDPCAGIEFARAVKDSRFDIPILLQSDNEKHRAEANKLEASFLLKSSPILLRQLRRFIKEHLSFGDFVFRSTEGGEVAHASDIRSLEKVLATVPDESLLFHAKRNHFSNWLKARTEFWLAHRLRPQKASDFATISDLRQALIRYLRDYRRDQKLGQVTDFDAESFDTTSSFARIGGGSLGGKARGLGFVNSLLSDYLLRNKYPEVRLSVPASVVIGTDAFDEFLDQNNLRDFAIESQFDAEIYRRFLISPLPGEIIEQLDAFLELIHFPLAVRSSSLLEDSKYQPFAGIYSTFMLPNNHQDKLVRLEELTSAIKRVYASTFTNKAKSYISATPYRLEEEKMAVIVQKLVGKLHEKRFYPDFAGVARSHNFYPTPPMKASDGIACVALGLGKIVVEGGRSVRFCPSYPKHLIQFSDTDSTLESSQKEFYALELEATDDDTDHSKEMSLQRFPLSVAEDDGVLASVASTYSVENHAVYDGVSRTGIRLVTFAPILKSNIFPLAQIVRLLLELGRFGMNSPVEMEFAVDCQPDEKGRSEFSLLQMRPLVKSREMRDVNLSGIDHSEIICDSPQVLGNGVIDVIHDVIMVDIETFDRSKSRDAAHEIAAYNSMLLKKKVPYLLIGVGRLGSADPWLGIPVSWGGISGARVIVESGFKDLKVVPSQGTHFFQNITSFTVGYFTVNSIDNEGDLNWKWLMKQKPVSRKEFTRHLRFDKPLIVKMDGHSHRGVILKPGYTHSYDDS